MKESQPERRYRFGVFEADTATGELRRQGVRVRLHAQPFQVLVLLLDQPGELLTREELSRELWPGGTFVDYEHGLNSAVNRIREALGDTAANPRFIETLARRGYRFVAPVERIADSEDTPASEAPAPTQAVESPVAGEADSRPRRWILASEEELPKTPYAVVRTLFVLLQLMYVGFYVGALANLTEIADLLSALPRARAIFTVLMVTAAILIPVRAFVLSAVLLRAPGARKQFLRLWPFLLLADVLWSLAPFLLLHHINFGLALACTTLLVYSPFAQRSLMLMGAGGSGETLPAAG
jgi:DNA-binding winged helix-turn-helix (wHTH) protein